MHVMEQRGNIYNYLYEINLKDNTLRILLNNLYELFTKNNSNEFKINKLNENFSSVTVLDYPKYKSFVYYEEKQKEKKENLQ